MLEKQTTIDRIEAHPDGTVAVRMINTITEDGVKLMESVSGKYIAPGDSYAAEDARVQAVCAAVQTPEVIMAYKARAAENITPLPSV